MSSYDRVTAEPWDCVTRDRGMRASHRAKRGVRPSEYYCDVSYLRGILSYDRVTAEPWDCVTCDRATRDLRPCLCTTMWLVT